MAEEFTATVGDELKDLGVIVKIEAHYGRVKTSSGAMIHLESMMARSYLSYVKRSLQDWYTIFDLTQRHGCSKPL